jgi:hypothetical protein
MKRERCESMSATTGATAVSAPQEARLSESECCSLAASLIADMSHWFEPTGDCRRQLVSAFVESDGCELAVREMLLEVRLTAIASKVPVALRAIRVNFGDVVARHMEKEESERDLEWNRSCVIQHLRSWIGMTPHLSVIWLYKLTNLYPELPDSWRRSLLFTEEATYSITPSPASELLCDKIMARGGSANATIVDAFACVGGDSAVFSRRFRSVHSIELDSVKIPLLRHNLRVCLNCHYQPDEDVEPPTDMLTLPANIHIHLGDCRTVVSTLQLVRLIMTEAPPPPTTMLMRCYCSFRLELAD